MLTLWNKKLDWRISNIDRLLSDNIEKLEIQQQPCIFFVHLES